MATSQTKTLGRHREETTTVPSRARAGKGTPSRKSKSAPKPRQKQISAAQADFIEALEESVDQANAGELTPIEPLLDELWAKYGDGKDSGI